MNGQTDVDAGSTPCDRFAAIWEQAQEPPDVATFLRDYENLSLRELTDVLLIDQSCRWRSGSGLAVEEYLAAWPQVAANEELKLDLAYGEWRARINRGEAPSVDEYIRRFPQVREALICQVEVGRWLHDTKALPVSTIHERDHTDREISVETETSEITSDPRAPLPWSDFELKDRIGAGAMGQVYRAVQKSLNRIVAVKILTYPNLAGSQIAERFLREARAVAQLRHPNIVSVHGIGRCSDGGYFLVMDLVQGGSLQERIQNGPLEVQEAVRLVVDVADAIDYANRHGVIHRDLKPSNVLIDEHGRAVVTDFGLAKCLAADTTMLSTAGQIIGTPQYMAPEQADSNRGEVGPATDVYGLGALFYALIVGRPPIDGVCTVEVISWLMSDRRPVPPSDIRKEIPPILDCICLKCLCKVPSDRYKSAREVADALRASRSVLASVSPATRQRLPHGVAFLSSARTWLTASGIAVLLVLVAVLPLFLHGLPRSNSTNPETPTRDGSVDAVDDNAAQVKWTLDVYRRGQQDARVRLTDQPAPVFTGDSIRVQVRFPRPQYACLFWIGSDGTIERLYPNGVAVDKPVKEISLPTSEGDGLPIRGPEGTEICVLVFREVAITDLAGLSVGLQPSQRMPPLAPDTLIVSGRPIRVDRANAGRVAKPEYDVAEVSKRLRLDAGSRSIGSAMPLSQPLWVEAIARWRRQLRSDLGQVEYLAIPHGRPSERATHTRLQY